MKNIFKNQKNKTWNIGIVLVISMMVGVFVQSCSDEDYNNSSNNSQEANVRVTVTGTTNCSGGASISFIFK
jgi:hypothetical protein